MQGKLHANAVLFRLILTTVLDSTWLVCSLRWRGAEGGQCPAIGLTSFAGQFGSDSSPDFGDWCGRDSSQEYIGGL